MKSRKSKSASLAVLLVLFCWKAAEGAEGKSVAAAEKSWPGKMQKLESALQELLIDLSSDQRFRAKENFQKIEEHAQTFASLAHAVKTSTGEAPDADASIAILSDQFASASNQALRALKSGQREYARTLLRTMTGYCISCHTRNATGPSFQAASAAPLLKSLKDVERADYYAAIRQFDQALSEYERIASIPRKAESYSPEWERAVRSGLAIAIRVKKDPDRALRLVDRVLLSPTAPLYLKTQANQWKVNLSTWKLTPPPKLASDEDRFKYAITLLAAAKSQQAYPADRSADVLYLRASAIVHDLLSASPNGPYAADALFLAGISYEVLRDSTPWDIQDFYYLACIAKAPHTERARQCFTRYEQSVYFGYTGSGGIQLPSDTLKQLKELDRLSGPSENKKD